MKNYIVTYLMQSTRVHSSSEAGALAKGIKAMVVPKNRQHLVTVKEI